jgi:putative transposase
LFYVRCWQELVFFAFIVGAFIGWQLAAHVRTDLVLDALKMALGLRGAGADVELVHHSDRGSQPRLNRSSQRRVVDMIVGARRAPRRAFSSRVSCGGGC